MKWGRIIKERDMAGMTSAARAQAHGQNAAVWAHRAALTAILAVSAGALSIGLRMAAMVMGHG